ncbi:MAG: thioredoxin family protein [Lautropia sp.]|nr:thioredoxin family protein [Lautropia sp.]
MMRKTLPLGPRLLLLWVLLCAAWGASLSASAASAAGVSGHEAVQVSAKLEAPLVAFNRLALAQAGEGEGATQGAASTSEAAHQSGPQRVGALEIELVADVQQVVPGEPFRLGLRLRHDPHWHTYWRNPGDTGFPTRFDVKGPAGAEYSPIVWPAPERFAIGPLANYGYEGETLLYRDVVLPADFKGRQARFTVDAEWLICRDVCVPGEAPLALSLPVGGSTVVDQALASLFDESRARAPAMDKPALSAGWWQRGAEAVMVLPPELVQDKTPGQVTFLPYFAEVIRPVAEQRLVELSSEPGRFGLVLAVDEQAVRSKAAGWEAEGGILLIDGQRPVEVALQRQTVVPVAGKTLATSKPTEIELSEEPVAGQAGSANGNLLGQLGLNGQQPTDKVAGAARSGTSASASGDGADGVGLSASAPATGGITGQAGSAAGIDIKTLLLTMAAALLGGLILNLMPCVFPVIGLKILSFTEAAAGRPAEARRHAMVFCLGVMTTFVALALLLVGLRSLGQAAGWGFQLQSPVFVSAMALLFVAIGLNLFGVFEAGSSFTRFGSTPMIGTVRSSYTGSFMTGVMAVVVATPCTAPFMGSAVGFTLSSTALEVVLVFAALGLGMGIPYLVLASSNALLAKLPRPGPWLQTFRQLLAFPMFATTAWLVWVLAIQTDAQGVLMLLIAAILLSFAAWIYGRWQFELRPRQARSTPVWLLLAVLAVGACVALVARMPVVAETPVAAVAGAGPMGTGPSMPCKPGPDGKLAPACEGWQPWSPERLAAAQAAGQPVFVDFTAAWCLSCQVNKRFVLEREEMLKVFRDRNILLLRADWTRRDEMISAELARFGRNSVPFYLFYDGSGKAPQQLPELLTIDIVMAAIGNKR